MSRNEINTWGKAKHYKYNNQCCSKEKEKEMHILTAYPLNSLYRCNLQYKWWHEWDREDRSVYTNKACRSEELDQHQYYLTLTYLNVVWPNVEGCHQALQEISDPSEVGASNAPGAVHQQHDVCCCIAVTLKWFPWRHTLINRSTKQIVLKRSEFRDL